MFDTHCKGNLRSFGGKTRWKFRPAALGLCMALAALPLTAQFKPSTTVPQSTLWVLKPPAGARVAIIEFEDLQCPSCGQQNPVLKAAAAKYHVPWVRHDFPLPQHNWSFQAAVNARWFDTKSQKLGDAYRDAVFAYQNNLSTPDDLRDFTNKFAKDNGIAMPFLLDPQGKLADAVKADRDLGIRMGVHQTPTVWVVTNKINDSGLVPYVEVDSFSGLYGYLDQAINATGGAH
jgi:protein-disulfide isomerase